MPCLEMSQEVWKNLGGEIKMRMDREVFFIKVGTTKWETVRQRRNGDASDLKYRKYFNLLCVYVWILMLHGIVFFLLWITGQKYTLLLDIFCCYKSLIWNVNVKVLSLTSQEDFVETLFCTYIQQSNREIHCKGATTTPTCPQSAMLQQDRCFSVRGERNSGRSVTEEVVDEAGWRRVGI